MMVIYLKVNVSHTEVDDNGCKREKYAVHLERRLPSVSLHGLFSVARLARMQQRGK